MKCELINEYGHCHYCICKEKDCAMIYNLHIKNEYRRKGHAKELIQKAINEIRILGYEKDIKIVAEPEEESINKEDLVEFYKQMNLKVIDSEEIK